MRGQGHTENSTFTDGSLDPHSSTTSADSLSDEWEGSADSVYVTYVNNISINEDFVLRQIALYYGYFILMKDRSVWSVLNNSNALGGWDSSDI